VPWHYIDVRRDGAEAPDGYPPEAGERTTVMGLWVYFVLANLRVDAQVFHKVWQESEQEELIRSLPHIYEEIVSELVFEMIRDGNGLDLIGIILGLISSQKSRDEEELARGYVLRVIHDRVWQHTRAFKTIYPDAKHPILV
jgi:hypothetical protein